MDSAERRYEMLIGVLAAAGSAFFARRLASLRRAKQRNVPKVEQFSDVKA
jgi:hypothetical protein